MHSDSQRRTTHQLRNRTTHNEQTTPISQPRGLPEPVSLAASELNSTSAGCSPAVLPMARPLFSKTWIDVSGSSAEEVAKQLRDQPSLVMKLRPPRLSLEHHQLPHQTDTPVLPPPPVRASPADGWVHIDVERHFVIGVVRLAQAGERVGDRILRSRDVLVTNRHEGALELLGILVERHEALR
jgi:hypothetical protein